MRPFDPRPYSQKIVLYNLVNMRYYLKIGLEHFAFGLIIPVSIIWKLNNGLSLTEAAGTEALILLTTSLMEIPTGVFADKHGNKKSLIVGGLLQTIAMILMAYGGSLTVFGFASIASGIGWAFISGADQAYIHDDYIKDTRNYKQVFANASIIDEITTILGMLSSGLLLSFYSPNPRILFVVAGIFLFCSFTYTIIFLPRSSNKETNHKRLSFKTLSLKFNEVKNLLPIFLAFALVYESGRVLWQPQLKNLGIEISKFGIMFAFFKLASLAGSLAAKSHRFSAKSIGSLFVALSCSLILFGVKQPLLSIVALLIFLFPHQKTPCF